MLQKLRSYPALIIAVPKYEQRVRNSVEQIKAVAQLVNEPRRAAPSAHPLPPPLHPGTKPPPRSSSGHHRLGTSKRP